MCVLRCQQFAPESAARCSGSFTNNVKPEHLFAPGFWDAAKTPTLMMECAPVVKDSGLAGSREITIGAATFLCFAIGMRFLLHAVVPVIALASVVAQPAFGQGRIATVDMTKAFDSYWRTKQADAALKEQAAEMDKELKGFVEERTKLVEEYQKALAAANDPALSAEQRDKRKADADKKLQDLRELEKDIQDYDRQARVLLDEKRARLRANLVNEIRAVIEARAKSAGYTLVIDSSAMGANNVPIVLYRVAENDLTEDVIKQLNATAPAGFSKSAESKLK